LQFFNASVNFFSESYGIKLFLYRPVKTFTNAVGLRTFSLGLRVINIFPRSRTIVSCGSILTISYIYQYGDHLNKAIVSFAKNSEGALEVTDTNNYYPFGLKHEGYNILPGNPSYNYKYNGKEL